MLGDDYNGTKAQLDSIRARRTKFICVNDNVDSMTPQLAALFEDFFRAFYPKRSQFELPPGARNRHLRLDAYRRDARRDRAVEFVAVVAAGVMCVFAALRWRARRHGGVSGDLLKAE